MRGKTGFTLIELLMVVGILAVLATVTVLFLNPIELLKQSRDAIRVSDLRTIHNALSLVQIYNPSAIGSPDNTIYVSLPSATAPNCDPSLPAPPGGWSYICQTQDNYRKVNNQGWIPVDFAINIGSPFSALPIDPINNAAEGLYYTFVKGSWELNAKMESESYDVGGDKNVAGGDGGDADLLYEVGTSLVNVPTEINDRFGGGVSSGVAVTSVTGQNPQSITGGRSITVNGTGFLAPVTVTVGGTAATNVVLVNPNQITANAPAKPVGSYDVVVNTDSQNGTCIGCMNYTSPPTVVDVNPNNNLNVAGGETVTVTVTGSGIKIGEEGVKVDSTFATTAGTSSSATFTTPAHSAGSVTLRVYGISGTDSNGIYTDYTPLTYGAVAWRYRKPVTINNTSNPNNLTNYQILITTDTSALITGGKMNSDCSDLRIRDTDGSTDLSYWIESGCNTASTKIWAKIPSVAGSTTKTIFMYYGNPAAGSIGAADSVFLLFDEFTSSNAKWVYTTGYSYGFESDGYDTGLWFNGDAGASNKVSTRSSATFSRNIILEGRLNKNEGCADHFIYIATSPSVTWNWGSASGVIRFAWNCDSKYIYSQASNTSISRPDETRYDVQITLRSTDVLFKDWRTDTPSNTDTRTFTDNIGDNFYIYIGADQDTVSYKAFWYWLRVRQYASPEPAISVGVEESL